MLDARALESLVVLAADLHFGRAADRLGITQSVLSVRIRRLEDTLGAPLLTRGKRAAVRLTRAGAVFLPEAQAAVTALEQAERIGRLVARGEAGTLRIGYVLSAATCGLVPRLVGWLRERFPALEADPHLMETPEQLAAVADGRIDLAILRPRPSYPAGVEARVVHREGVLLAVATDDPLAGAAGISPAMLAAKQFVMPQFHEQVGLIDTLNRLAVVGGFSLGTIRRTGDFVTTLAMVAGGHGVAVVPRSLGALAMEGVAYCPIAGFPEEVALVLAHRPDLIAPGLARAIGTFAC